MKGARPGRNPQVGRSIHADDAAVAVMKGLPVLVKVVIMEDSCRGAAGGALLNRPGAIGVGKDLLVGDRFTPSPVKERREGA